MVIYVFVACKKDNQSVALPTVSPVPSIVFNGVSKSTIKQFVDSLKFDISFIDGDGNLGDYNADSLSLIIADNRNSALVNKFYIPPVTPQGSSIVVQGHFFPVLKSIILLDTTSQAETTTFSIKLKDRAGNWSNTVTSSQVIIKR